MEHPKNIDKVFEDLLEDDFVNCFKPVFLIQRLFGVLRIHIQYKFVTPPTKWYRAYGCGIWLVNSICIVYTVFRCRTQFDSQSTDTPLKLGMCLNGIVSASLAWRNLCFNGDKNSQLLVKLQRIERILKMKNAKRLNERLFKISLSCAAISVGMYMIWIYVFSEYLIDGFCPSAAFASTISSACIFEIFLIFEILYFISLRVQFVNDALMQEKYRFENVISGSNLAVSKHKVTWGLVHGMSAILESFSDTMDLYQLAIFLNTFLMLAWQLITMQNLVVSFREQMSVNLPSFLCTLPSSVVFISFMLILCSMSQSLTTKLETCSELCTAVTSTIEGESRQIAKRIAILVKGRRPTTVFGIFTLDTRLPFHLFGITASYTIVLLQFATL